MIEKERKEKKEERRMKRGGEVGYYEILTLLYLKRAPPHLMLNG